jgi:hypothetical protein
MVLKLNVRVLSTCAALFAVIVAGRAEASTVNLLTNPGFETGNFSGWTVGGTSSVTGVATQGTSIPAVFPSSVVVRSGTFAAFAQVSFFNNENITLSQTLTVLPSTTYSIGYYAGVSSGSFGFQGADILINGVSINPSSPGVLTSLDFSEVLGSFTTGAAQTSLTVLYAASGSGTGSVGLSLDDFFFTPVPLPAALPLFASGLAGLGLLGWRRKRKAAA